MKFSQDREVSLGIDEIHLEQRSFIEEQSFILNEENSMKINMFHRGAENLTWNLKFSDE